MPLYYHKNKITASALRRASGKVVLFVFLLAFYCLPINAVSSSERIDINTASAEELQRLTGIGPVLAQNIIKARPFYSLDDLVKVDRIGPKTLEKIKEQGLAWISPELETPEETQQGLLYNDFVPASNDFADEVADNFPITPSIFLIALGLAGFSGGAIFALKKNLKIG